jgi:hypothetical protein
LFEDSLDPGLHIFPRWGSTWEKWDDVEVIPT